MSHSKQILSLSTHKNIQVRSVRGFSWFMVCYVIVNLFWRIFSCENVASDPQISTSGGIV